MVQIPPRYLQRDYERYFPYSPSLGFELTTFGMVAEERTARPTKPVRKIGELIYILEINYLTQKLLLRIK